jgi:hypothetical protein
VQRAQAALFVRPKAQHGAEGFEQFRAKTRGGGGTVRFQYRHHRVCGAEIDADNALNDDIPNLRPRFEAQMQGCGNPKPALHPVFQ